MVPKVRTKGCALPSSPLRVTTRLTVDEVAGRLGGLFAEELRVVRDYEERNKRIAIRCSSS